MKPTGWMKWPDSSSYPMTGETPRVATSRVKP